MHLDGSVTIEDDGRGIPVDIHPKEKVPGVQLIFTELHSGGKFRKKQEGAAYSFSGGLHGVGVSVTNALSTRLEVEVRRDGKAHRMVFTDGGHIDTPLTVVGKSIKATGTTVRAWPDGKYFDTPKVPQAEIERILCAKSVLLPGVVSLLRIEHKDGSFEEKTWFYQNGLRDYLDELCGDAATVAEQFSGEYYASETDEFFSVGEGVTWAVRWLEDVSGTGESYVNLIPTPSGGTHVTGLRAAMYEAVKSFAESHGMMNKGLRLTPDDTWRNVRYVVSAKILEPQFRGQTKEHLDSREGHKLVLDTVKPHLEAWLVSQLALSNARARLNEGKKVERKRSGGVSALPGKLTEAESNNPAECELFLVEGDSAGGSAKQARSKANQAILPLKGKIENTWEVSHDSVLGNSEVHDIAVAMGIDPHSIADIAKADLSNLRYHTLAIMADADDDGRHISTLLLTLFFRHFPAVIAAGHLYIAQAPLYRIDAGSAGKNRPARKLYAMDEAELEATTDRLTKEGYRDIKTSRFKGLGEMNPEQLWETTMSPDTRRMLQVRLPEGDLDSALQLFNNLMGKKEAAWRRGWMSSKGYQISE
jgi:topoisomerase-4 subunit B